MTYNYKSAKHGQIIASYHRTATGGVEGIDINLSLFVANGDSLDRVIGDLSREQQEESGIGKINTLKHGNALKWYENSVSE